MAVQWFPIAEEGSIPKNEGRKVVYGQFEVAVFNLSGGYRAIDNRCPHKKGPLSDGIVSGNSVFCPLHNLNLSLETGCALRGGAGKAKIYPAKLMDNKICVAFYEGKFFKP
jgi:nitrite reductase (NADH) small subunit